MTTPFRPNDLCLGVMRFPEQVLNFNWMGPSLTTFAVTATTSLYCVDVKVPGMEPAA